MRITLRELSRASLAVVDLTEKGVGIGVEADYTRALNIPAAVIAEGGAEIAASLVGIASDIFTY